MDFFFRNMEMVNLPRLNFEKRNGFANPRLQIDRQSKLLVNLNSESSRDRKMEIV